MFSTSRLRTHCCHSSLGLSRLSWRLPLLIALVATQTTAQTPSADAPPSNIDVARSIAISGREAYGARDFETAAALFQRAYSLFQAPTLVLYEARALREQGKLLQASAAFTRAANLTVDEKAPPQFADAIETARLEGLELAEKVPTLTIRITGADAQDPALRITRNGELIGPLLLGQPLQLNPGDYRVAASLGNSRSDTVDEHLQLADHKTIVLDLTGPVPLQTPPTQLLEHQTPLSSDHNSENTLTFVSAGIGVAGIGAGLVTGMLASNQHKDATSLCSEGCVPDSNGAVAVSKFRSLRTASTVAYSVGAAGTVGSMVLWFLTRRNSASIVGLKPWIGRSSAGVQGRF